MFSQHPTVDRRLQLFWRIAHAMRHRQMKARELAHALDDLRMIQMDAAPPLQLRIHQLQSLTAR